MCGWNGIYETSVFKTGEKAQRFEIILSCVCEIRRGADKFLAFPIFYFPICSTKKGIFLDGLKKLEQRSRKYIFSIP
jgi:hypothetical protein